jgi:uncharacterized protein
MKRRVKTRAPSAKASEVPSQPAPLNKISATAFMEAMAAANKPMAPTWELPKPHPGVLPEGSKSMAMDSGISASYGWALQNSIFAEGLAFPGYTYLAELTQRAEYRRPAEIVAKEMTRKWIRLQAVGEDDSSDRAGKIKAIQEEMKRLNLQKVIQRAAELDGYFGRAQIFIDTGDVDGDELSKPLALTAAKIPKGSLKRLAVLEPLWTYPNLYGSINPLAEDFYRPSSWFVMGKEVHASRLLTVVGRPLPDMLKPAYAFGGLSLSQIAKPYVDNWLRTRQSVSDLVHAFSVMVFKTDMSQMLTGGSADVFVKRLKLFTQHRDNLGVFAVNKDSEEFDNVSAPLAGLAELQSQAQEQMSACTGIPLSILLGITPHGLNASSEGEIRTFYSWVEAQQEAVLTAHVQYLLQVIQLSLFGEIDPGIGFMWEPLWAMSKKELAEIDKLQADADDVRINNGTLSPHEARVRLANDEDSPYAGLDLDLDPIPPAGEEDVDTELQDLLNPKPGGPQPDAGASGGAQA